MGTPNPDLDPELILESAPALIHTGRPDGHLDFFNRTWLTYVGRSQEDLLGWNWTTFIHPDDLEEMLRAWRSSLATGQPFLHEARVRRADGAFRWMLHHKIALRDEPGNITRWYGSSIDIEDRRRTEDAQRQSEERYRAIIEVSPQIVWTMSADGLNMQTNQWWYQYTGLTRPETEGLDSIHPEHRRALWKSWRQAVASGSEWTAEAPFRRAADGQYRWHLLRGRPIRDAEGRIVRWMGIGLDIHDRRVAEEALRESEAHYRALIEVSPQMVWMTRPDGYNVYMNQWWYDYTGLTSKETEGFGWVQTVHPEQRDQVEELWRQAVALGREWRGESRVRRKDGQYRWHYYRGVAIRDADGKILRWIGTSVDIHDRRESEEALRRTQTWLSEAQRLSHTGSFAQNLHTGELVYVSPEILRIYGFDPAGATPSGEDVIRRFHPEDRPKVVADLERAASGEIGRSAEWRLLLPDGTLRHIESRVDPIFDAAGRPVELIGTTMDVTDRKHAAQALRDSEERYRNIFEKVGVAIVEQDFSKVVARLDQLKASGVSDFRRYLAEHPELARETLALVRITDVNEAAIALFGASSKEELLGELPRLTTREVRAAWASQLLAVAEGRSSVEEIVLTTLRNETIHALVAIVLPPESSGFESVLVNVVDLSDRKRAEEALSQAQAALAHMTRVTTLGELTASIAHEVNQPLAAIVNNASASLSFLSQQPTNVEELRAALEDITSDAQRASAVIERVRAMAKRSPAVPAPLQLADVVDDVLAMAAAESARRRVTIRPEVALDLPSVAGDRVQLQQVLLNLVVNGMDAMATVPESQRLLEIRAYRDVHDGRPAVTVSVRDHGVGLKTAELDRLFDAFYSTKPHGMGMGLAISRSIIEAHHGSLRAEANRGPGASFSFCLPAA